MNSDLRIKRILEKLSGFSEFGCPVSGPISNQEDDVDAILAGLNTIGEHLYSSFKKSRDNQARIDALINLLLKYTRGDFSERAPYSSNRDEIDAIAAGLNSMVEEIEISSEELRKSKDLYHNMIDGVVDYAIILLDPNGVIANWNMGAEKLKGYAAEEVIGNNISIFYTEHDRISGKPGEMLDRARKQGKAMDEGYRLRKDGTTFWGNIVITALRNKNNEIMGFTKITRDLSEIKEKEERLRLRASQLEATNKELESFSYSVSHDLRAPLRAVHGYSQMLIEDFGDKLDEEGNRIINIIMSNARMMGKLIDDLLAFSRMGRKKLNSAKLDLNELVNSVISSFNEFEDHNADITVDPLPEIYADYNLMTQVFFNLISNAVKFSSKVDKPTVQIGSLETDNELTFFVRDNGAGFDMRYYDKLFGVFQRLHHDDEFEGTGVGLPIVRQIISRHGGKVWAEGKINEGATIYFTI